MPVAAHPASSLCFCHTSPVYLHLPCILLSYIVFQNDPRITTEVPEHERSPGYVDCLSPRSPPSSTVKFCTCHTATSAAATARNGTVLFLDLLAIYPLDVLLRISLDSCSGYCALATPFPATEIAYNSEIAAESLVVKKHQWAVP